MPAVCSNLDFEYVLSGQTKSVAIRQRERWSCILRLLAGLSEAEVAVPGRAYDAVTAWGWDAHVRREFCGSIGPALPSLEAVGIVNDKRWSHAVERQLGIALPRSAVVTSLETFGNWVRESPHDWIVKHPFGVSGREAITGSAGVFTDGDRNWVRRRLRSQSGLVVEPRLSDLQEFSVHYEIDHDGASLWKGVCELITDSKGVFRGHYCGPEIGLAEEIRQTHDEIIRAVYEAGYFGPVSLDMMVGTIDTKRWVRPLTEINARYSFGRLALALGQHLPQDWRYLWWHPSKARALQQDPVRGSIGFEGTLPGLYRLPEFADPEGRSGTRICGGFGSREGTYAALELCGRELPPECRNPAVDKG